MNAIRTAGTSRIRAAIAAWVVFLAASTAPVAYGNAEAASGWYYGIKISGSLFDDAKSTISARNSTAPFSAIVNPERNAGYGLAGTLGYRINPNVSLEGKLYYGRTGVNKTIHGFRTSGDPLGAIGDRPGVQGGTLANASGTSRHHGIMLSARYDVDSRSRWKPYIGGGIGLVKTDVGDLGTIFPQNALATLIADNAPPRSLAAAKDSAVAYHLGIGTGYRLSDLTTVDIGWRYRSTGTLKFRNNGVESESRLRLQLLEVGIRRDF